MTFLAQVRRRFARPPEEVRAAMAADPDERVLTWGVLARDAGWLAATSRGLRRVGTGHGNELLPWHEVGHARWAATTDGGGTFAVTPLTEVEPGVQARLPVVRHVLTDAGDLPAIVRRRVDQTIVTSRRVPLPGRGGLLLVARRVPGQAAREWTVVFDDDADRDDPVAREAARRKLAEALAADQPD
ncbi:hypothetical protein [Blastococcus saxobsidens]|uniref:Uncharacterized protein n=1 Tax=Blastococcus saxobsidens (strain DD2) TaxID=1146883 RepID=H6RMB5_BLASD|nr:hypothetical protein [Blastococcus saxobsidens]CCG02551.1 conserved protein of unknown function [Blastococcus saxobsidens DD2]